MFCQLHEDICYEIQQAGLPEQKETDVSIELRDFPESYGSDRSFRPGRPVSSRLSRTPPQDPEPNAPTPDDSIPSHGRSGPFWRVQQDSPAATESWRRNQAPGFDCRHTATLPAR